MIADTTFIIDVMNGDHDAIQKAKLLQRENSPISVTSVSIFELYVGVGATNKREEEVVKILDLIDGLPVHPLDEISSREAGIIYTHRKKQGKPIQSEDAMIAGICKFRNDPLLTRNVRHFAGIDGLSIERY